MSYWSLLVIVLAGLAASGSVDAAEIAPAAVAGNQLRFAPQQTPGGTVVLRGSVPVDKAMSPAKPSRRQDAVSPDLSSSSGAIGWDRAGLGPVKR